MAKKKARVKPPTSVVAQVMKEFNHRCSVCGADRPQLHHIDEDPSNNAPLNLIPLCPNCHLTDQHDASNRMPVARLQFFRRHKHRRVLCPQFRPLFRRMQFLYFLENLYPDGDRLAARTDELIAFVSSLRMGEFYGAALRAQFERPLAPFFIVGTERSTAEARKIDRLANEEFFEIVRGRGHEAENLIVELLDYQDWDAPAGGAR